ncbi:MAG: hypothetical protein QM680_14115 [Luteolibacter sp.]
MNLDWQTIAALGIVLITLSIFTVRFFRPKARKSCGHDCGCGKKH